MSIGTRKWVIRHSRFFEIVYSVFEKLLVASRPLINLVSPDRQEKIFRAAEKVIKGRLFDCQMCGACVLGSTGMSCPMNCPKQLRNGPCGGVRSDGACEVVPNMTCVWLEAWVGSRAMKHGDRILTLQPALNFGLKDRSAWVPVIQHGTQSSPNSVTARERFP